MLINDRIKTIIKANSLSPSQFADKIGIKRSNLSHVLSGRNKPSLDFLSKVLTAYPSVNAGWLITGETSEGDFKGGHSSRARDHKTKVSVVEDGEIESIVVFYKSGTFKEYSPSEQ
jgi:transcriptional regulator with XRE-family HTH domain